MNRSLPEILWSRINVFGVLSLFSSGLLFLILFERGDPLLPVGIAPLLCLILVFLPRSRAADSNLDSRRDIARSRRRRFSTVATIVAVIVLLTSVTVINVSRSNALFVSVIALFAIASSLRASIHEDSDPERANRTHFFATSNADSLDRPQLRIQAFMTPVLILIACIASSWLCGPLFRGPTKPHWSIGLIPEAYFAIKLLIGMYTLWLLVHASLSYFVWIQRDKDAAEMRLIGELWKWNGSEQLRISRESQKNVRASRAKPEKHLGNA